MKKVFAYLFASDKRCLVDLVLKEELMETKLVFHFHSKAWLPGLKANGDQPKGEELLFCGLRATEHPNVGMKLKKFSVDLIITTTTLFPRFEQCESEC